MGTIYTPAYANIFWTILNLNKSLSRRDTNLTFCLDKHISTVEKLDRNEILNERVREKPKHSLISLVLTSNRHGPNIRKFNRKHWNLLVLNGSLKEIFNCQPITPFKQSKILKELIESNKIEKKKGKKDKYRK